MNDYFRDIYETLLIGIGECEKNNTVFSKHTECCFHISKSVLQLVDEKIRDTQFSDTSEEIYFFKKVKPKFTSFVEFYSMVYRAELFAPVIASERGEYWAFEVERTRSFLDQHKDFIDYLANGDHSKDEKYFLRITPQDPSSPGDKLLAEVTAYEMYADLLKQKLST